LGRELARVVKKVISPPFRILNMIIAVERHVNQRFRPILVSFLLTMEFIPHFTICRGNS